MARDPVSRMVTLSASGCATKSRDPSGLIAKALECDCAGAAPGRADELDPVVEPAALEGAEDALDETLELDADEEVDALPPSWRALHPGVSSAVAAAKTT